MRSVSRGSLLTLVLCLSLLTEVAAADEIKGGNPPADGFRAELSDPAASASADRVMEAMGGRRAYDATRYVSWLFFGRRQHYWDRYDGDIRIEGETGEGDAKSNFTLLYNIQTKEGRAFVDGSEITDEAELAEWLERAYDMWVNDSYWVFMPYKLKDSGVALKYLGRRTMEEYGDVEALELRFEGVGKTPENRYEIFVDPDTWLVAAWSYFETADLTEPGFTLPWGEWQRVGRILLAGSHGRGMDWQLRAYDELPREVFEDPAPVKPGDSDSR
jgi:hypothetical protein